MDITLGEYLPRVDATYDNMKYHKDYKEERYTVLLAQLLGRRLTCRGCVHGR